MDVCCCELVQGVGIRLQKFIGLEAMVTATSTNCTFEDVQAGFYVDAFHVVGGCGWNEGAIVVVVEDLLVDFVVIYFSTGCVGYRVELESAFCHEIVQLGRYHRAGEFEHQMRRSGGKCAVSCGYSW